MELTPPRTMRCYEAHAAEIAAAWGRVEDGLAALPAPLDALGRRFLARIGAGGIGTAPHRGYFSSALGPPLVYLPLWMRDRLCADDPGGAPPAEAILGVVAATMWGYFYIRIQDDILDEGAPDRVLTLLGNACLLEMARAWEPWASRAPGLAEAFSSAWMEMTAATLAEHEQMASSDPYSAVVFEAHARKVAFARAPMLAVCALAGRSDLAPEIDALVHALGVSYGLTNDAWGWPRDLANGQRTYLLARAGLQAGERGPEVTRRIESALHEGGLLVATLDEAIVALDRAARVAERMRLAGFAAFAAERRALLEESASQSRLYRLQRVLAAGRGATS